MMSEWQRLELARERRGYARHQFAIELSKHRKISRFAIEQWQENGIPSDRLTHAAEVLQVSQEWIQCGRNAPAWHIRDVAWYSIKCGSHSDYDLIDPDALIREWQSYARVRFMHYFATSSALTIVKDLGKILLPDVSLDRRCAIQDIAVVFHAISNQEEALRAISAWPKCQKLGRKLGDDIKSMNWHDPDLAGHEDSDSTRLIRRRQSRNPAEWTEYLRLLRNGTREWLKARRDESRQRTKQSLVARLLDKEFPIGGGGREPELAGDALLTVLAESFHAAWTVEIVGPRRSSLESGMWMILVEDFRDCEFTIRDFARRLMNKRDIDVVFRKDSAVANRSAVGTPCPWRETISERTISRAFEKFPSQGRFFLAHIGHGTWKLHERKPG